MTSVTVIEAIENLDATQITTRKRGLEDLRHILRYNQTSGKIASLGDDSFHAIFEALFRAAIKEKTQSTRGASEATRSSATSRLADTATTLRQWIEAGAKFLTKPKTVRAVYDHVIQTICYDSPNEGLFCETIALDYAKSLRALFSYQPHVERLGGDWAPNVDFVIDCIAKIKAQTQDNIDPTSSIGTTNSVSYRSSRSGGREPSGSQGSRSPLRTLLPEMMACLHLLTSVPNAPMELKAASILTSTVGLMQTSAITAASIEDAFRTVNHVLSWSRTEAISLTKEHSSALLRIISNHWTTKANARDQMSITLLLLRPFIMREMQQSPAPALRQELSSLLQVLWSEHIKRQERERLNMDDLRLRINSRDDRPGGEIGTALVELRCSGIRAECNWLLLSVLASIHTALNSAGADTTIVLDDDSADDVDPNPRNRKRQRTNDHFGDLLRSTSSGPVQQRVSAMQILLFYAQQHIVNESEILRILGHLSANCGDDNGIIAAWAFLVVACLAAQPSATDSRLAASWAVLWQVGCRSLSNAFLCRTASYALHIMIALKLVLHSNISDLVQNVTNAMDLSGPSQASDAASLLLTSISRAAQQINPGTSAATAEAILQWTTRSVLPSRFEDRSFALGTTTYDVCDILALMSECLKQDTLSVNAICIRVWEEPARMWLLCDGHEPLIKYLLLDTSNASVLHPDLVRYRPPMRTSTGLSSLTGEATILSHFATELTRTRNVWDELQRERRQVNLDSFLMLCKSACLICAIATQLQFRDAHRMSQFADQATTFLDALSDFVSSSRCDDLKADGFFMAFSVALEGLHLCHTGFAEKIASGDDQHYSPSDFEKFVLSAISRAMESRQSLSQEHIDQDTMDLDEEFQSQSSGQGHQSDDTPVLPSDLDVGFGKLAMRQNILLYTRAIIAGREDDPASSGTSEPAFASIWDYLQESPPSIFICRDVIKSLPRLGVDMTAEDVLLLLETIMKLFKRHAYARSEVSLGADLDILLSQADLWTDPASGELYKYGLDLYEWWTVGQLGQGNMSPNVQKRLADLLVRLCQIQEDYAADEADASTPRTSLFKLLRQGRITLQFHLADKIPLIFRSFVLSTHELIFDDLQSSLSEEIGSLEGIALRLLVLANLGSEWPSLLRRCVYYIFEAAGRATSSAQHATSCIQQLASRLPLRTPQKLFSLFASQLLYTWLDSKGSLASLPFATFQYGSLEELLQANEAEISAQLVLHDSADDLKLMSGALETSVAELLQRSFAKAFAYAIGRDMSVAPGKSIAEHRLYALLGGKEKGLDLIFPTFPAIMGHLFLIMQQDDVDDQWLMKSPKYQKSAKTLAVIKKHGASRRQLPRSQQPSFPSSHFLEQYERLLRRIKHVEGVPWDPVWFPMVVRMLLNAMDESLGSLHTALMIRRIRACICLADDVALNGFGLEVLINSLRHFVSDRECADDTLGILWYLFDRGRAHLSSNPSFLRGAVMLLILRMRQHSRSKQDHMTQQSQHKATTEKMAQLQSWLVGYLQDSLQAKPGSSDSDLADSLKTLRLPGNARKDTAESRLLLYLLDQRRLADPPCPRADITEAISLLSDEFESPRSVTDDCLGDDAAAAHYSNELWQVVRDASPSEQLIAWAAQVVGRAYASTGDRPVQALRRDLPTSERAILDRVNEDKPPEPSTIIMASQFTIATRIVELIFSRDRQEAGLADLCLRRGLQMEGENPEENTNFEQMLPQSVLEVIRSGPFHYQPGFASQNQTPVKNNIKALGEMLMSSSDASLEEWATDLALYLCSCAAKLPEVQMLDHLFHAPTAVAVELLPSMVHLVLYREAGKSMPVRAELSSAVVACLSQTDRYWLPKQRLLLDLLVYLRAQPRPKEATRADRLRWLDVDCLLVAEAAAKCGKPTIALLFAEQEEPVAMTGSAKRSSTRKSLSLRPAISDDLLLSIYEQIEEPDSFYGVEQPASLASVLSRLDHESDGFKSLMLRSAQMDSNMRNSHDTSDGLAVGMAHSLSNLSFNSLALSLLTRGADDTSSSTDDMLNAARSLQQWDIAIPEAHNAPSSTLFSSLQEFSRSTDLGHAHARLQLAIYQHAHHGTQIEKAAIPSQYWFGILAQLTEIAELAGSINEIEMLERWQIMQARNSWMQLAKFEDANPIISNRQIVFSVMRRNAEISEALHLGPEQTCAFEAQALLAVSKFARGHSRLQEALTAVTSLSAMDDQFANVNLNIAGAIKQETALVLWDAGEAAASVRMIRDTIAMADLDDQDIAIGLAGLHAQLGHQLAHARLEKPEDILSNYLTPSINYLHKQRQGEEAGKVYHEFATFCDNELQSASNEENLNRIVKNRQGKQEEIVALEQALHNHKRTGGDKNEISRSLNAAKKWLDLDVEEEKRLFKERENYVHQSLQNYLLALQASDSHDLDVLRFFALWLENCDDEHANTIAIKHIPNVPSWKFVLLMNQLMSRMGDEKSTFQSALLQLLGRICGEHPHHSLHHLFAARSSAGSDPASSSRHNAAGQIHSDLTRSPHRKVMVDNIFRMDTYSEQIANWHPHDPRNNKVSIRDCQAAERLARALPKAHLPPVTMSIPLRPSGDYDDVPIVTRYDGRITVMSGNSAPKALACLASDGVQYKQLFKDGDDLRQDAIMEQVFEEVSKMLRNHKATRQRDLKVRTYKVIPLSSKSGIIEFVPNSTPLNEVLRPAHRKYYPSDWDSNKARKEVDDAYKNGKSVDERIRIYRRVCEHVHPVLRHFFFEQFNDPDEWFHKRTAYTRTTASISILGYILGLGDRHNSNIMLDKQTGEVVHIDLGVAFEAGRVLPIPELIPFRLTRDIVDGFGVTKTEGVFRRCCEFTLEAVREDKGSIMTLLNVLRYDPLYSWQSNARAKKMQEAQGGGGRGNRSEQNSSTKREQEAGEADRALSIVEKKLSKALSTSAAVNELIQQAMDERHLGTLFCGWAAWW